jgi:serine/threonine-protein kinase
MAEVVLARDRERDRLVVIKRLRAQLALDPEFVQMFLAEGQLALTLRHPNVVEVFDVGQGGDDAGHYIAMEYLHGHDLRDTVSQLVERHATVRLDQALSVARAVAAALHYTHEHTGPDGQQLGIVHRDVSPHNVLLTFDGRVKLVDFGIAKSNGRQDQTRTGVLKGKAAYMAPEQAMGMQVDRRSDVFCLGILMWEMTTGQRLFRRRTELETLNAVAQAHPPRPSRIDARYPRDLENLIMKTLAPARQDRWATAAELIDAIDELARQRKVTLGLEPVRALTAAAFAEELAAWRAVQAFGISLGDHLVARNDREVTRPNDLDLETRGGHDHLPTPVFELTRQERPAHHHRRRWLAVAIALAIIAAAGWFVVYRDSLMQADAPPAVTPASASPAAPSPPRAAEPAPTPHPAEPAPVVLPPAPANPGSDFGPPVPQIAAPPEEASPALPAADASAAPPHDPPTRAPATRRPATPVPERKIAAPVASPPSPPLAPGPLAAPGERAPVKRPPARPSRADLDKLP